MVWQREAGYLDWIHTSQSMSALHLFCQPYFCRKYQPPSPHRIPTRKTSGTMSLNPIFWVYCYEKGPHCVGKLDPFRYLITMRKVSHIAYATLPYRPEKLFLWILWGTCISCLSSPTALRDGWREKRIGIIDIRTQTFSLAQWKHVWIENSIW